MLQGLALHLSHSNSLPSFLRIPQYSFEGEAALLLVMDLKCDSTWLLQLRGAQIGILRPGVSEAMGPITLPLGVQPDHLGASWGYSVFCSRECCVLPVSSISIMDPSDLMRVFVFLRCPGHQVVGNWSHPVASHQKLNP